MQVPPFKKHGALWHHRQYTLHAVVLAVGFRYFTHNSWNIILVSPEAMYILEFCSLSQLCGYIQMLWADRGAFPAVITKICPMPPFLNTLIIVQFRIKTRICLPHNAIVGCQNIRNVDALWAYAVALTALDTGYCLFLFYGIYRLF